MIEKTKVERLYFLDAIRAWAILMMLQGHFVSALLADAYKDLNNPVFAAWYYLRGVTAPVFFTIAGFVFTFLLIKNGKEGWYNPRVKKGVVRGLQLIFIGYLLQIRFGRLFKGAINESFAIVHVLQCLGLSILLMVVLYLVTSPFRKRVFAIVLCTITVVLFICKTEYESWNYAFLPEFVANYFTTVNGSVFTIIPWFGFTSFGGFLAVVFSKYYLKVNFYRNAIIIMVLTGSILGCLAFLEKTVHGNYLFTHLGVVLLVFSLFLIFRNHLNNNVILRIGQLTLPIYIVHSIILYNSITGYGLSRFYSNSLPPFVVIIGAICFVFIICLIVLKLGKNKVLLSLKKQ